MRTNRLRLGFGIGLGSGNGLPVVPPITPATISITAFNDATDEGTIQTDTPSSGVFEWAVVARGGAAPTPQAAGGWAGTVLEVGTAAVGASGAVVDFVTSTPSGTGDKDLYVCQRIGTALSNVLMQQFNIPYVGPTFASSVVDTTFASADWGSRTLDGSGWWAPPTTNARADTAAAPPAFPVPSTTKTYTFSVDMMLTGANTTVSFKLTEVSGTANTLTVATNTWTLTGGTGGIIDMGSGIYRVWGKKVCTASARLFLDFPLLANANIKVKNPAMFDADLTVAEIGALV